MTEEFKCKYGLVPSRGVDGCGGCADRADCAEQHYIGVPQAQKIIAEHGKKMSHPTCIRWLVERNLCHQPEGKNHAFVVNKKKLEKYLRNHKAKL